MLQDNQMITVERLAKLLDLSPRHIRNLIDAGEIKAYQLGKVRGKRIMWKDAKAFIESRAIQ